MSQNMPSPDVPAAPAPVSTAPVSTAPVSTAPVSTAPTQPTTVTTHDALLYFIALFVPPLAVYIKRQCSHGDCLINFFLWLLGWIPGVVHAWWIIRKY